MFDQKFKRTKKLHRTIEQNLERRTVIVDDKLVKHKSIPLPSWIELSIIDVCNRNCVFCPKSDPKIAPDTYQKMSTILASKISIELKEIGYNGSVTLCGYGEPMLHKEIYSIIKILAESSFVEIVTNGDTLKPQSIIDLYNSNANKLLISLYDGPEQIKKFKDIIKESGVPDEFVMLRDRWYDANEDYGLKLTNRSGTINVGQQEELNKYTFCNYPAYSLMIDWNGDVFLCPQDWQRRITMGNVMQQHIFDIWTGSAITKYRKNLLQGKRCDSPCKECNAEGTVLGNNHAKEWKKIFEKK